MFGIEEYAGPASFETWVRRWWPFVALVLGVLSITVGAVLFAP